MQKVTFHRPPQFLASCSGVRHAGDVEQFFSRFVMSGADIPQRPPLRHTCVNDISPSLTRSASSAELPPPTFDDTLSAVPTDSSC